jgi:hypothetical protein
MIAALISIRKAPPAGHAGRRHPGCRHRPASGDCLAVVDGIRAILEEQENHHLAMLEVLDDEAMQGSGRVAAVQVSVADDLEEHLVAIAFQHH